ncbi:type II secretion system protein [Gammaproteobacteria bacterium]|nr:type II secretion system GspH family protein [Gammaproteobacteria bacterium]MDC1150804.1 type II secretion system protein [Gammaproteobacteria bacterium]
MTQILEIGCNNSKKGFTLIEILVVLVLIGITSSLIFLNLNSVVSVNKNQSTFIKSFSYLSEESIVSGNIIGWHANNDRQFFYFLNSVNNDVNEIKNPYSKNWQNLNDYKKTFKSFDGTEFDFEFYDDNKPLLIFYPSGESSGGFINIFFDEYIQKIEINTNGKITSQIIDY